MGDGDLIVTRSLKLPLVVTVQVPLLVDDGSPVTVAGPILGGQVPLSALSGCQFYKDLLAKVPEIQAHLDTEDTLREAIAKTGLEGTVYDTDEAPTK